MSPLHAHDKSQAFHSSHLFDFSSQITEKIRLKIRFFSFRKKILSKRLTRALKKILLNVHNREILLQQATCNYDGVKFNFDKTSFARDFSHALEKSS